MKNYSFQTRLIQYSAMTAGFLIASKQSESQIIYTDVPDQNFQNSATQLDLNNDGIYDLNFITYWYSYDWQYSGSTWGFNSFFYASVSCNHNYVKVITGESLYLPLALEAGAPISENNNWDNGGTLRGEFFDGSWTWNSFSDVHSGEWAFWPEDTDRYLGIRLEENSSYYYGWVRLRIENHGFTLKDYAYMIIPDEPINAGETDFPTVVPATNENTMFRAYQIGGQLHIVLGNQWINSEIKLTNTVGQVVKEFRATSSLLNIDISALPAGIYIIDARNSPNKITKKILLR